uniref:Uncharacterized protein n=1 Tax=Pyricularia oryzae (strain P131) TaxID=1143193 RepID=L7JAK6_PYRO1
MVDADLFTSATTPPYMLEGASPGI